MITKDILFEYQTLAEPYVKNLPGLTLNHIAIGAKDSADFEQLKKDLGPCLTEVNFHGRRIATVRFDDYLLELLEPKPDQKISETTVDHIGFVKTDFDKWVIGYTGEIASRFDVGNTHGIKLAPKSGIIIEIRNNRIQDSIDDFNSSDK